MTQPVRIVFRSALRDAPAVGEGLRVALYQGQGPVGSREAVQQNMDRLAEVTALAAAYDCQVVVFPEKYTTGYAIDPGQCRELAEHREGPSIDRARLAAKENSLAVVLPYPERDGSDFYDSISVIAADGQVAANYRKTHLYGAAERRNYSFGQDLPPLVTINGITVGVLNCYECEFPPLYQYLAERGAQIVLGPTAADGHFRLADGTMSRVAYQDATRHIIPAMASVWRLVRSPYANRRGLDSPRRRLQYQ
ncbi:nitrilase-related carbon-nitrogen hydrolase, partial [Streptomyces sp. Mg1]|uniref:nitrilase-related carbon-nitrogen hydrolase n=1 Tax=Streptomyces sp. Mg1 TaxID=465541 RepID=UPI00017F0C94